MTWLWGMLEKFFNNNSELLAAQQTIDELRDKLQVCRDRLLYYKLGIVAVGLWAAIATLVAIELALH